MTLEFSGGEKLLYDCRVQLDPTALKFSDTNLYITETRMVFELEEPVSLEISEIMELKMENFYGERFIYLRYKDIKGVHSLRFVCTGFGGIISNISKTIFVHKLISKLRGGAKPHELRFLMSGSTLELYLPWILLAAMVFTPAAGIMMPLSCWLRFWLGVSFLVAFALFTMTDVYKLLLGSLRIPASAIVFLMISSSIVFIWNTCSTVEVAYPALIYSKEMTGDANVPDSIWYCAGVRSEYGEERLCLSRDDWDTFKVGDKVMVYYDEGPLKTSFVQYKYDDRTPEYVLKNRR
ncbi:MAG: hypothetical protein GF416_01590 [Candidatus Altiarchaeales archaeon]|nr:hypothetical protein [Candidatus Altiarchaeales archaeon]MBD3415808.1 hypothetical protein [Candidatus Altiarchaeales archaeon]